jgi:voltage-gated potassium channel Kch
VERVTKVNVVEKGIARFLRKPPTVRAAASVIVIATICVVVGAGILISIVDRSEYPNIGVGMWWALQTVTTVGYGDVAPQKLSGRLMGAVVMLQGIAFIAIITAVITSTFVARASREYAFAHPDERQAELGAIEQRLGALEQKLDALLAAREPDGIPPA